MQSYTDQWALLYLINWEIIKSRILNNSNNNIINQINIIIQLEILNIENLLLQVGSSIHNEYH